jgi:hypothetical protein
VIPPRPTALVAPRAAWDELQLAGSTLFEIDVRRTPIARLGSDTCRCVVVARDHANAIARVSADRPDPADPKPWNVDDSLVWDPADHPEFAFLVIRASTSLDDNLLQFLHEHVFWVKEDPREDHWLQPDELPAEVRVILDLDT